MSGGCSLAAEARESVECGIEVVLVAVGVW